MLTHSWNNKIKENESKGLIKQMKDDAKVPYTAVA